MGNKLLGFWDDELTTAKKKARCEKFLAETEGELTVSSKSVPVVLAEAVSQIFESA